MSRPILVGYEPTRSDPAPVRFGVMAARLTGAPLVVAAVAARPDAAAGEVDADLCADASLPLERLAQELQTEGMGVACMELRGTSAARALHEAAESENAALLVVGSPPREGLEKVVPGSTAERLMHGSPCPVGVVPREWEPPGEHLRTIGVGFVDTEEAREALRGAHALAQRTGASLRVITVVKVHQSWYLETETERAGQPEIKDPVDVEGEHRVRAEQALRRVVAELGDDVPIEAEAFLGEPAEVLADLSRHLDLLVLGSRGYGPVRSVLLGGVSRRVAAGAHCPAVVLPRGVKASLETLVAEAPGAPAAA